jgi:hypothetical protein
VTLARLVARHAQRGVVLDTNLRRIVAHRVKERADKPELDNATHILATEAARRESLFEQSVEAEKTRDDALAKRFEEALKHAHAEPVSRPTRDFDFD